MTVYEAAFRMPFLLFTVYESNHPSRPSDTYHCRRTHPHRLRRTNQPLPHADAQRNLRLPHPQTTGSPRHHRRTCPKPHRGVQRHLPRSTGRHRSSHPAVGGTGGGGRQ